MLRKVCIALALLAGTTAAANAAGDAKAGAETQTSRAKKGR